VFHRFEEPQQSIYRDLGTHDWKAIVVDAAGWQILDRPTVRFRRSNSIEALPIPVSGMGDIDLDNLSFLWVSVQIKYTLTKRLRS